jgi:hypothetical protein
VEIGITILDGCELVLLVEISIQKLHAIISFLWYIEIMAPVSLAFTAIMSALIMIRNLIMWTWFSLKFRNVYSKFHENLIISLKDIWWGARTDFVILQASFSSENKIGKAVRSIRPKFSGLRMIRTRIYFQCIFQSLKLHAFITCRNSQYTFSSIKPCQMMFT